MAKPTSFGSNFTNKENRHAQDSSGDRRHRRRPDDDRRSHLRRLVRLRGGQGQRIRRWRLDARRERGGRSAHFRSEEHTSELQSLMRISYAVFCLKKKKKNKKIYSKQ